MDTTNNANGVINYGNNEPEVYYASYPSPEQQKSYRQQGAWAILLVLITVGIAFAA